MTHVGTDEAGYGPTLGPLVITATVWRGPGDSCPDQWYEALAPLVTSHCRTRVSKRLTNGVAYPQECDPVIITDSKKIYQSGRGFRDLERSALSLFGVVNRVPENWRDLIGYLDPNVHSDLAVIPWFADFNPVLPVGTTPALIENGVACLRQAFRKADLACIGIRSQFVTAMRFNRELERFTSKGELLSNLTLRLVADILLSQKKAVLWADKHGGRDHYARVLYQALGTQLIQIEHESPERSAYRIGAAEKHLSAVFLTKAERLVPVAAASIISKYVRELAMLAFNRFWQQHKPDLAPTAGYPADARRFLAEIATIQEKLGIPLKLIRRKK
ncbi:MAG: hypothetical protein ACUVTH_09255 [Thermogutta sp.]